MTCEFFRATPRLLVNVRPLESSAMSKRQQNPTHRLLVSGCAIALLFVVCGLLFDRVAPASRAQDMRPILISEAASTRAVAVEGVTRLREPFGPLSRAAFGTDKRTRLQFFALHLYDDATPANVTVEAEDAAHRVVLLPVEYISEVPEQPWMRAVTVRLPAELGDVGDVLVRLKLDNVESNRVRVGIGHVGGGLPDDVGAYATPAPPTVTPTPNTNPITAGTLSTDDVRTIIAQAVSAAVAINRPITVAVTDREGNVLGVFQMTGAATTTQFRGGTGFTQAPNPITGLVPIGLEGTNLPPILMPVRRAAVSKAGTAAFFSTQGNAFTTRTAGFIVQEHIPPGIENRPGGPLFGVQFSSLDCSDIKKALPFGISGDVGSVPLYRNGVAIGGVGIEGDGVYGVDRDPSDFDKPFEEVIAVAAGRGYEPPALIRGDNILVDGVRLPYLNVTDADAPRPATIPFANLPGRIDPAFPIRGAQPSAFVPLTLGGVNGAVDLRFFPFRTSISLSANRLTNADVTTILAQGAQQANITRGALRHPLGSSASVSIAVTDADGFVLGIFRTVDAPVFGFDVSVQKARSAAFFSRANAGALLRAGGFGAYVDRAAADGIMLNGAIAMSDRSIGFLHRPFFPDDIVNTPPGPFSTPIDRWSIFNVGLQLDLIKANLELIIASPAFFPANVPCTNVPGLANGLQIFAGSVPLYKNGELVGAIGISGDGIDQDDIIAAAGSRGYVAPANMRADQVFVRGTRLPYVKFPRSPNL